MAGRIGVLVLAIVLVAPAQAQTRAEAIAKLDASIRSDMAAHHIPGLAIAIVGRKGIIWSAGYGFADLDARRPMKADTIFPIASISKTVIAVAMMKAKEEGRLDLDRDINRYLPFRVRNPHAPSSAITLRRLATHVSGIRDYDPVYSGPDNYHQGGDNPIALGDFLRSYLAPGGRFYAPANNFTTGEPGHVYSNVGAALAAYVVQCATNQPFNAYTASRLFRPLGMKSTGWRFSEIDASRQATLYRYVDGKPVAYGRYALATWPDGGLRTTVIDLARYVQMTMNRGAFGTTRVLSSASIDAMLAPQSFNGKPLRPYDMDQALFWSRYQLEGRTLYGHSGADPGVRTQLAFDADHGIGVLLFANVEGRETNPQLLRWIDAAMDAAPDLSRPASRPYP